MRSFVGFIGIAAAAVRVICILVRAGTAAFLGGRFDFVQVFGGKKAPVAQQGFIHRTQLVDRQQLVADTATALATAPALTAGQRHQADDGLPDMVGETHAGQQRQGGFIKQAAVQRGQSEGVFGTGNCLGQVLLFARLLLKTAAGGHQAEQAAQGGIKVKAVARMRGVERLQLQLTQ